MIETARPAGRLLTVRTRAPFTRDELTEFTRSLGTLVMASADKLVVCVDVRQASVLPAEQADSLVEMLRRDNPKIERTVVLLPSDGKAILALQLERMAREGKNPARKTFRYASELYAWVEPVLTPVERAAVRAFYDAP